MDDNNERLVKNDETDKGYVNKIWSKKSNKELIIDALDENYSGIPEYSSEFDKKKDDLKNLNLWTIEGSIYPSLDSMGIKGEPFYRNEFELGANQKLTIAVSSKTGSSISLHQSFDSKNTDFTMNFRSGCDNWFRVDNQLHNYLHFHLKSGTQLFEDKIKIDEGSPISQIISDVFDHAESIVKWKFPEFIINRGKDFVGTT